jgi:hypothetical protein
MSEESERDDRDERLRAEPGEAPNLADRLTAAAYREAIEHYRAKHKRRAG